MPPSPRRDHPGPAGPGTAPLRTPDRAARPRPHRATAGVIAVVALAILGVLAGCSSSDDSSDPTTSASPASTYPEGKEQVCAARDQLQSSVGDLVDVNVLTAGTSGIQQQLDQVRTDLTGLRQAAGEDYRTQVDALEQALDDLQAAVEGLGDGNLIGNVSTIGTAIGDVGSAASDLTSQLAADCG